MEEEVHGVENLLKLLPGDMVEFVFKDNAVFQQEIVDWDKVQLDNAANNPVSASGEASTLNKENQTDPTSTADPNNDVQVDLSFLL